MSGALSLINRVAGPAAGAIGLASNLGGVIGQFLQVPIPGFGPVMFTRPRRIDTIIPNVAIEEMHRDRLTITNHPVEIGAAITDHAFKEPVELTMRCGWSNSQGFSESYSQRIYNQLLSLQNERRPFDVTTGKRQYKNMMILEIDVTTDVHNEFSLIAQIHMREVILVKLATVRAAQPQQKEPEKTAQPNKGPEKTPQKIDIPPPSAPPPVYNADVLPNGGNGMPPDTGPGPGDFPPSGTPSAAVPGQQPGVGPADVGLPGPSGAPIDPNANPQAGAGQPSASTPTPVPSPGPGGPSPPAVGGPSFDASVFTGT